MDAMEMHCAPRLQLNLPVTLCCLSHRGQFKAMGRGGSKRKYMRVSLAATVIGTAGRERPAGTALDPGSSRFPSGIPLRRVSASGASTARLPRRAPGRGEERRARLLRVGLAPAPAGPPHAHPRPPSCRPGACDGDQPSSGGLGKGRGCRGVGGIPGAPLRGEGLAANVIRASRVSATYGGWI